MFFFFPGHYKKKHNVIYNKSKNKYKKLQFIRKTLHYRMALVLSAQIIVSQSKESDRISHKG